jgi:hypothetical protein
MSSCAETKQLFKAMFPDSNIAASFTCGETKARYLCTFGLGPYFSSQLLQKAKSANSYVLLFDETLNKHLQEKQMDIYIRIWEKDCISTKYLDSKFMGHATSDIMLEELTTTVTSLGYSKLLQLSMDGPNVNLKLEKMLKEDIAKQTPKKMIEIGTCGLHILHNAFKAGSTATHWDIDNFISSCYHLFHDSPARRDDFCAVYGATVEEAQFPKKFCTHRWLENADAAQRIIDILPTLKAYLEAVNKKKVTRPMCKSFIEIEKGLRDPLLQSKLEFFAAIAREVEPFLSLYQTDRPMIPFLFHDLGDVIKNLMTKIVKSEIIADCKTVKSFLRIDLNDCDNLKEPSKVDIFFMARRSCLAVTISDRDRYEFKSSCRDFIKVLILKVLDKAPIRYKLVQNLSWLQPKILCSTDTKVKTQANGQLNATLNIMYEAGRVRSENCDTIKTQYSRFCDQLLEKDHVDSFRNFDYKLETCRLDQLLYQYLGTNSNFQILWTMVQQILLLSHGQASVERGFSLNKTTIVENLQHQALRSRRHILQAIQDAGGSALSVPITKEMLSYASSARGKYDAYLKEQTQEKMRKEMSKKRNAEEDEILELKSKRKRLETDAKSLEESANRKAREAEDKGVLSLIAESNALRKKSQEKLAAVKDVDKLIADKTNMLSFK